MISEETRKAILERDNFRCVICGSAEKENLTIHHLIPKSAGGSDVLSNLITICVACHTTKYHMDLYTKWQVSLGLGRRFVKFCMKRVNKIRKFFGTYLSDIDIDFALGYLFDLKTFRHGQKKVIKNVLGKHDVFLVAPTGRGKSLCYQLPASITSDLTLVVSPLISLMKDQHRKLAEYHIPSTFLSSDLDSNEKWKRIEMAKRGMFKMLYVAPERFRYPLSEPFLQQMSDAPISLFVVDEAHCVDKWGTTFRPDYATLKKVHEELGNPPILALTATATPKTTKRIINELGMRKTRVIIYGFDRPNISFNVIYCKSSQEKNAALLNLIKLLKGPGIVYTSYIKSCENVRRFLSRNGVNVGIYHGKLGGKRDKAQFKFMNGETEVLVATKAFGMGVDKSNIRYIIHYEMSGSMEDYYQEIGRAGRDEKPAVAILLYDPEDQGKQRFLLETNFPKKEQIKELWEYIRKNCPKDQEIKISRNDIPHSKVAAVALKLLQVAGAIDFCEESELIKELSDESSNEFETPVPIYKITKRKDVPYEDLNITQSKINKRKKEAFKELDEFIKFVESKKCRRKQILSYFGERKRNRWQKFFSGLKNIGLFFKRFFSPRKWKAIEKTMCCDNCETYGHTIFGKILSGIIGTKHRLAINQCLYTEKR